MARVGFSVEKLLEILDENGISGVQILKGSGAPGGDTGEQDASPIGSIYLESTGQVHVKIANAGAAADWFSYNDVYTILGMSPGDLDSGTYSGAILTDNTTVKANIQELADYITNVIDEQSSEDGVTSVTVIDDENVDNIDSVVWHITVKFVDDRSRKVSFILHAGHNGHIGADATSIDDNVYSKNKFGAAFNYTIDVVLSGSGASQVMQLRCASTETNGVDVRARTLSKVLN